MVSRYKKKYERAGLEEETNKIFIISMEGAVDEDKYFEALKDEYNLNVRFEYITTCPSDDTENPGTKSAPNHVLNRLRSKINEKETFNINKGDEAWLVMDFDRWGSTIHNVISDAERLGFGIAISNISFNTWLFMHDEDWNCSSVTDCSSSKCKKCSSVVLRSGYTNIVKKINIAVTNAKNCETQSSLSSCSQIPPKPGSRVYKLIEKLGVS